MVRSGQLELVRLVRDVDVAECARRNALSREQPGLVLRQGQTGILLETLEGGLAFLVEFGSGAADACDWLGVLYTTEVEVLPTAIAAAA